MGEIKLTPLEKDTLHGTLLLYQTIQINQSQIWFYLNLLCLEELTRMFYLLTEFIASFKAAQTTIGFIDTLPSYGQD